jgi:hypothetical protein
VGLLTNPSPEVLEFFEKTGISPVDLAQSPEYAKLGADVVSLAQKLVVAEDGIEPIRIAIVDSMHPNAFFFTTEKGEKVLGLNQGILRILESDDELAFVIGHELEHGVSKLTEQIERLKVRGDATRIELFGLGRAVENEVDVGAVLRRIHRKGFNPYGALHLMDRFVELFGDSMTYTHTLWQSRKDSVSLALSALRRGFGEKVKSDAPTEYQTQMVKAAQKGVFGAREFRQRQMRKLEELIARAQNPFTEVFEAIKRGTKGDANDFSQVFQAAHDVLTTKVVHLTYGLTTPNEQLDTELRLYAVLDDQFENARSQVLGSDPNQLSHQQLQQLQGLYKREYLLSITDRTVNGGALSIVGALRRVRELEPVVRERREEIARAHTPDQKSMAQAKYDALKLEYEYAVRTAEQELYTYHPQVRRLIDEYERLNWEKKGNPDHEEGNDSFEERVKRVRQEINFSRRVVGPIRKRSEQRAAALFDLGFDQALKNAPSVRQLARTIEGMLRASPERIDRNPLGILDAYLEVTRRELLEEGWGWGSLLRTWLSYNNEGTMALLDKARAKDPKGVERFFRNWVDIVIDGAPTVEALDQVFKGASRPPRVVEPFFVHGEMMGGLWFSPNLARGVWTEERVTHYLSRLEELFHGDLDRLGKKYDDKTIGAFFVSLELLANKIEFLKTNGLITPAMETNLDLERKRHRAFEAAAKFLVKYADVPNGRPLFETEAKSFILARLPELRRVLDPQGRSTPERIISHVTSIASQPELSSKLPRVLSYFRLPQLFEGRNVDEKLFPFLYATRRLINFEEDGDPEFTRREGVSHAGVFELGMRAAVWARAAHPEDGSFRAQILNPHLRELHTEGASKLKDRFGLYSKQYFKERFEYWRSQYAGLSYHDQIKGAAKSFWPELPWVLRSGSGDNIAIIEEAITGLTPETRSDRLAFFNAYVEGVEAAVAPTVQSAMSLQNAVIDRMDMDGFTEAARTASERSDSDPTVLRRTYEIFVRYKERSPLSDALFERLWNLRDSNPEIESWLEKPERVGHLYYDENKKKIASWQLEKVFSLEETNRKLKRGAEEIPPKGSVRLSVGRMKRFVDEQFKEKSAVKNDIVRSLENAVLANAKEIEFLASSKITVNNWYESRQLAAVDLPQQLSRALDRYQQYTLLLYLIGASETVPKFQNRVSLPKEFKDEREVSKAARRHFFEADIYTRTYALQPLLDETNGPLKDPHLTEKLFETVLGEHGKEGLYREVVRAYFDALPSGEKKSILAYVFSSMADAPGKPASVKKVLEAMGVFGIKAGQFLRTSGFASPALRKELDGFFDRALEPQREEIFRRLSQVFGEGFRPIQTVRELAGSGSVNYVVIADVAVPSKDARRVVLRIRRDSAEGQVANENDNWTRAIRNLNSSQSSEVRKLAAVLGEARSHAMETLKPGGAEMDLSIERRVYGDAVQAYGRERTNDNAFSIEVARPVEELQALVPEPFQKLVSIYEAVKHVPLNQIEDPQLRARAAFEIAQAELEALFMRGVFDPDGHPGNWLIDLENKRLVRIDYAQLRRPPLGELDTLKKTLRNLIAPRLDANARMTLANLIPAALNIQKNAQIENLIQKFLADPMLPDFSHPQERLFFVRERLERELARTTGKELTISFNDSMRSALSSLAKVQIYAEEMGQNTHRDLLLRSLGLNPSGYKAGVAGHMLRESIGATARSPVRTAGKILKSCYRFLGSLIKRPPKGP